MRSDDPVIDAFALARLRSSCEGEIALARLPRLAESLTAANGVLSYRIEGHIDDDGHEGATLHLRATLPLVCQRCNQPFDFALDRATRFRFMHDQQQLDALPIEDDETDAVVGSTAMQLLPWIEDEAILSLPLVPRHADCAPPLPESILADQRRASPFAALTGLMDRSSAPEPANGDGDVLRQANSSNDE